MQATSGQNREVSFAPPATYRAGTRAMDAMLRKFNSSLITFGIYGMLIAFAIACSLGIF